MSNNSMIIYEAAFERLKAGKPNNKKFIGMLITPSLVSKEAGRGAGALKYERANHRPLINEINKFREQQQEGGFKRRIAKLEVELKQWKMLAAEYESQRDSALSRELLLYYQLVNTESKGFIKQI